MSFIVVALGVLVAFTIEAMTGFGSIVLALSIGALVMEIPVLVQWLVPLNIMMTAPLVWRYRHAVAYKLLLTQILPLMGVGTLAGVWLADYLHVVYTQGIFALLICWFALRALLNARAPAHSTPVRSSLIAGAGVTHGLFASGGPLLVYALARTELDKTRLRATLLCVWLTLNSMLTVWFAVFGELRDYLPEIAMLLPCVLVGALLGNALHHHVSQQAFTRAVFSVLLIVGLILLVTSVHSVWG
ncbi:sulfite exporter TauE/SafE family protein [Alteromonas antoniana]|uniref:sulfite exporter TauE/SafE family protein n=1 Tax=Alteromonas antoniana TaxID=2803813 RepID=UPI001C4466E7|nr:sulfite exporter TauE/SafE family protein [Alteromonas antoniana]